MTPYNIYEIEKARREYLLERVNRERLADIARAGHPRSNSIVRLLRAVQRMVKMPQRPPTTETQPNGVVVKPVTHG